MMSINSRRRRSAPRNGVLHAIRRAWSSWGVQASIKVIRRFFGRDHVTLIAHFDALARVRQEAYMYAEAQELHWRALWLKERYYGRNHVVCATNLAALGDIYFDLGFYSEAEALHEEASRLGGRESKYLFSASRLTPQSQ